MGIVEYALGFISSIVLVGLTVIVVELQQILEQLRELNKHGVNKS